MVWWKVFTETGKTGWVRTLSRTQAFAGETTLPTKEKDFSILGLPENGTLASTVDVPVENLFAKPAHLGHQQAAALPLAGVTAWRALVTRGRCQPGDTVLVSGIGGGVALFAMQFAKSMGCTVVVTSSQESKLQQAELGADDGMLYTDEAGGNSG